jgi:hypothetical protein
MNTKVLRDLKAGELEVIWSNGSLEHIQTDGLAYNAGAIVCDLKGHKIIIPLTSVRRFRVKAV